ncbi:hypothetical protein ACF08N_00395 [Streptomyces sp. NPDC015127]|uniref:hypothetical protein n=1 Tax=Streptomyces sp. NPDC015127 TaxID=3364939 RepID=UPI0036FADFC3
MQSSQGRHTAALCGWVIVLVVLLPSLILQTPDLHFGPALALQCVVVAHSGGALTKVLTAESVRLVALGFWLFAYVWLGLAPLAMLATDAYPLAYRAGQTTAFAATALTELGLLAYSAGAAFAARRADRRSVVLEPLLSRTLAPVPVLLLCGLSLALAAWLIPQQGGVEPYFTSREAARLEGVDSDSERVLRAWILSVTAFWALLALMHLVRLPSGDRLLRGLRWMLLPLLVAVNVVVNNPISKPRFWAGTVLLALLFASARFSTPRAFRITAAALTTVVLLMFPYSDYFRYDERETLRAVALTEMFTSNMDYDAYQQMQTGLDYVHETGFSPSAALGPALFMVPRSVWPDKPQDTGGLIAQYAGYEFQNLSAPLWIETYQWAGAPSVVVAFWLLGVGGRRMDDIRARLGNRQATLAALIIPGLAFYQMIVLRGGLMAIAGPLLLLLTIPLFITTRAAARAFRFPSPSLPPATAGPLPSQEQEAIHDQPHRIR